MKLNLILLSSVAMMASAGAQTVIDIVGSTAGRGAVNAQILALLPGVTYRFDGAAPSTSARVIYRGVNSSITYIIRTYWQGSVDGVREIAQQRQQISTTNPAVGNFYNLSVASAPMSNTALAFATNEAATPTTTVVDSDDTTADDLRPEIGFSDVFQTSTSFKSPVLAVEDEVGIIPFQWFKSDLPAQNPAFDNMTTQAARALYADIAELPLHFFTQNTADTSLVYCTGRANNSGTRITALAESAIGINTTISQYGNAATDALDVLFLGNVTASPQGHGSGSGVAGALRGRLAGGESLVGYLGAADWSSATGGGAVALKYNGVPYSEANVQNGSYTFWGYLHQNRMTLTGNSLAFYNLLQNGLDLNPGTGIILDNAAMLVKRSSDGSRVILR